MAANTIDLSFVKKFESEVKLDYQRMGAKLMNTVRQKKNVVGSSTTMQRIGTAVAGTKARNGQVPINNIGHTPVEITLADYYAGEYVDRLDELKILHDERSAVSQTLAAAMGRKSDDLLITELTGATGKQTTPAATIVLSHVAEVFEDFGSNDVPDDGERYGAITHATWNDFLLLPSFASADYVTSNLVPFAMPYGMVMKRWYTFSWYTHSGLQLYSGDDANLCYHKTAAGFASGMDYSLDVTWQGKEQAHLLVGCLSQGAKVIDATGVYHILRDI